MPKDFSIPQSKARQMLKRLTRAKHRMAMSWDELAAHCGVARRSIYTLRHELAAGSLFTRRVCKAFGWSPTHFFGEPEQRLQLGALTLQLEAGNLGGSLVRKREILLAAAGLIRARLADVEGLTVEDVLTEETIQITSRRSSGGATPRIVEIAIVGREMTYACLSYQPAGTAYGFAGAGLFTPEGIDFCSEYLTIPVNSAALETEIHRARTHHTGSHRHIQRYHGKRLHR